jgi:hypothetical protein
MKDVCYLLADSHYYSQVLNIHRVSDVRPIKINIAKMLVLS